MSGLVKSKGRLQGVSLHSSTFERATDLVGDEDGGRLDVVDGGVEAGGGLGLHGGRVHVLGPLAHLTHQDLGQHHGMAGPAVHLRVDLTTAAWGFGSGLGFKRSWHHGVAGPAGSPPSNLSTRGSRVGVKAGLGLGLGSGFMYRAGVWAGNCDWSLVKGLKCRAMVSGSHHAW